MQLAKLSFNQPSVELTADVVLYFHKNREGGQRRVHHGLLGNEIKRCLLLFLQRSFSLESSFRTICPTASMVMIHEKKRLFTQYTHIRDRKKKKESMLTARKKMYFTLNSGITGLSVKKKKNKKDRQKSVKIGQNQSFTARDEYLTEFGVLGKNNVHAWT